MPDYENSRSALGAVWPQAAIASVWDRLEPLISPQQVRDRFLFGIPLVSALPDPITRTVQRVTDELIADRIVSALAEVEASAKITIMPTQFDERHDFDKVEFEHFGHFKTQQRPVASVEALSIQAPDGTSFFTVPKAWVEGGHLHKGQINILPLSPAAATFSLGGIAGGPAALIFLTHLARVGSIPAYWTVRYTAGFPNGLLPRLVNDAIGAQTAISLLSQLSATFTKNSQSLGIDGLSQSTSGPGPQQYVQLIKDLQDKLDKIVGTIRAKTGTKLFVGTV